MAFIPRREVRWLRTHDQRARHVSRGGDFTSREDDALVAQKYLEIALHGADISGLKTALEDERGKWMPTFVKGVTTKSKGAAVSIRPEGVIRIDWKTKATRLRPTLSRTADHLGRTYRLEAELQTAQDQAKELDKSQQEQRLLDMALQGNKMDAIIVAKDLYGFTTTQAHQFIDDLKTP